MEAKAWHVPLTYLDHPCTSTKLAVSSQPHVVGAKGGIRFSHRDPQASRVLERFVRDNASVISTYWGTGGDLNTEHVLIDDLAKRYCPEGTETALDALSKALHCPTSPKDIPHLLKERVTLPSGFRGVGWSLEQYSVGYVMAIALHKMLQRANPELIGRARLIVQGFGCVGATFAQAALELGIGKVVGISSQYGFLVDANGIDVAGINTARRANVSSRDAFDIDPNSLEAGLTQEQLEATSYTPRDKSATEEVHLATFLHAVRGEVFVPCAGRYILTDKVTRALDSRTFAGLPTNDRFIVSGANNIFPQAACRKSCLEKLDQSHILMLPEWVSNSGTANLFMRTCSGLALRDHATQNLTACADDTASFIDAVFAKIKGDISSSALLNVCEQVAMDRRARGAVNLLGVKRISHLTLVSPDAKRSHDTFTKLINVRQLSSGSLMLPGADDATLSIIQAPEGAEPTDTGLHVHFAVYNLGKTRRVLQKHAIAFTERPLGREGQFELELCGTHAGYPMSFRQGTDDELGMSTCLAQHLQARSRPPPALGLENLALVKDIKQLDHYTLIVPDASTVKLFHEKMMGYTHLRTITLNAGAAPEGEEDMLNHVMALPLDSQRVLVITEGLIPESYFTKLLQKKRRPYVHHIALEVGDVEAAFNNARAAGWGTTAEQISKDMLSGLGQFFLKEEEAGCFLELIERNDVYMPETRSRALGKDTQVTAPSVANQTNNEKGSSRSQGDFRRNNMLSLAHSMKNYLK